MIKLDEKKIYMVDHAPALAKNFVLRMLTRDLVALAELLL